MARHGPAAWRVVLIASLLPAQAIMIYASHRPGRDFVRADQGGTGIMLGDAVRLRRGLLEYGSARVSPTAGARTNRGN